MPQGRKLKVPKQLDWNGEVLDKSSTNSLSRGESRIPVDSDKSIKPIPQNIDKPARVRLAVNKVLKRMGIKGSDFSTRITINQGEKKTQINITLEDLTDEQILETLKEVDIINNVTGHGGDKSYEMADMIGYKKLISPESDKGLSKSIINHPDNKKYRADTAKALRRKYFINTDKLRSALFWFSVKLELDGSSTYTIKELKRKEFDVIAKGPE